MVLPSTIGGDGEVGHIGIDGNYQVITCDEAHYGPVSGGGVDAGVKDIKAVVRSGVLGPGGDKNGVSYDGIVTVGEGDREGIGRYV